MLPPKIGEGHEGSSFGGVKVAGAASSATAARRSTWTCRWGADNLSALPVKLLRETRAQETCAATEEDASMVAMIPLQV